MYDLYEKVLMWAVLFYSIFTACPLTIHRIHHWLNSKIVQQSNILTSSHHHILIRPLTSPLPISDHKSHSTATTTRKRNEKKNCIRKSQRYKNKRRKKKDIQKYAMKITVRKFTIVHSVCGSHWILPLNLY